LNVKLPTGYGKTFTACGVYSIRQHNLLDNRFLCIVPTKAQLEQFIAAAPQDLLAAGVTGPRIVTDLGFFTDHECIKRHRSGSCQVFAATIQYLHYNRKLIFEMMQQGKWMLGIDEYHHYGVLKAWGELINGLPYNFLLAMSATPYRPDKDSAFGEPHVKLTYREGVAEGVLKPLRGHAYNYRIDTIDDNGAVTTYTTEELTKEANDDSPDAIERFLVQRHMRWSPKYISPLISVPIMRMQTERTRTGQHNLQVLIGAMCVSHAKLICEQVKSMFSPLRCNWVGTGPDGCSNDENKRILEQFCPPKPTNAQERRKEPELDICVHVGMAGEGLDTVYVSEVVFARTANFNNDRAQDIGRASRILTDNDGEPITAHVSFDGSTQYANGCRQQGATEPIKAVGTAIMDAMDWLPPTPNGEDDEEEREGDDVDFPPELPEEPRIRIENMELVSIDSGDDGVQHMLRAMQAMSDPNSTYVDFAAVAADRNHPDWSKVIDFYRSLLERQSEEFNEKSVIVQWQDSVESAVSNCTGVVITLMRRAGSRIEKSLAGDIKTRINKRKRIECGPISPEIETLKRHYSWITSLATSLRETRKIPSWLS
jgi:superfamily II DNA or RNA helicase